MSSSLCSCKVSTWLVSCMYVCMYLRMYLRMYLNYFLCHPTSPCPFHSSTASNLVYLVYDFQTIFLALIFVYVCPLKNCVLSTLSLKKFTKIICALTFRLFLTFFHLILIFKIYASACPSISGHLTPWKERYLKHSHHFVHPFPWVMGFSNFMLQQTTFLCGPRCESCWDTCCRKVFQCNWSGTNSDGLLPAGCQLLDDLSIPLPVPRATDRFPEGRERSSFSASLWHLTTIFTISLFN